MREERRVCVVLCKKVGAGYRFGVLQRTKGWEGWELVKGHIEDGDTPENAALQEVQEEAGISRDEIQQIKDLDRTMTWTYEEGEDTVKSVCECFLAIVEEDTFISVDQNPHDEHGAGHFLNFRDAYDILTHDNQKELIQDVKNSFLH